VLIRIGVLLALLALGVRVGSAQVRPCAPTSDAVARPCELEAWLGTETPWPTPSFPERWRAEGRSGEVQLTMRVDTLGRLPRDDWQVTGRSDPLFETAVRNVWPRLRFAPGRRQGGLVPVAVSATVRFIAPRDGLQHLSRPSVTRTVDSLGDLHITLRLYPDRDSTAILAFTDSAQMHALAQLLLHVAHGERTRALCVSGPFEIERLRPWWPPAAPALSVPEQCPPTFVTSVRMPGVADRPPGWVDAVHVRIRRFDAWTPQLLIAELETQRGTAETVRLCEVDTSPTGEPVARCHVTRHVLH